MLERIQKILSARGIASRRKAEEYIARGLVRVNGKVAQIGESADPQKDKITVDGIVKEDRKNMLYFLMNKPLGVVTATPGEKSEKTVQDLIPAELKGKVYPVGRLDKDSTGLLLLTNDGVLARRLTEPRFEHEKEYEVEVACPISDEALEMMRIGMVLAGQRTKPAMVRRESDRIFKLALREGKNRQIRRMCRKVNCPVVGLRRSRILTLRDAALREGEIRPLTPRERAALLAAVGL